MSASNIPQAVKEDLAFVFVPGSYSPADIFDQVNLQLVRKGYEDTTLCPLLSATPKNNQRMPPAKLSDDALYIHEVIQAHLQRGKDVIIVMNSYGGFPSTEALTGLPTRGSIPDSRQSNRQAAVVGMVYVSSFLPFPGDSLRSVMDDYLMEDIRKGNPGGYMSMADGAAPAIFSDLQAEGREDEVKRQFSRIITQSSDSFDGKITYDMWKQGGFQGKVVYLAGSLDVIVPPELTRKMVDRVSDAAGKDRVKLVEILNGGHAMQATKPDVVVGVIEDLVSELVQSQ